MASTNEDMVVLARRRLMTAVSSWSCGHAPPAGPGYGRDPLVGPGGERRRDARAVGARACGRGGRGGCGRTASEWLLAHAGWNAADEGQVLAETPPFADGAWVAALCSGSGVLLVRHPEGGSLVLPTQAALGLLAGIFPAALQKLEALGFGLVQQEDQAFS